MFTPTQLIQLISLLFCFAILPNESSVFAQKIKLDASMVINELGTGTEVERLVDEQDLAGDPAAGKGGIPKTAWVPGWGKPFYYPAPVIVDLKDIYDLTSLYLYDGEGSADIKVEYGQPLQWKPLFVDKQLEYNKWVKHDLNIRARYLRFSLAKPFEKFTEIILYGKIFEARKPEPAPQSQLQPTIDEFIGVNGFSNNPIDKLMVAGLIREYHLWNWDEGNLFQNWGKFITDEYPGYPNNRIYFNDPFMFQFDNFYEKCKDANIIALPCIKESVSWISMHPNNKPIARGADSLNPASYIAHANYLYQFIARYGSKKVEDSKLKLHPNETRVSGLNTVNFIENWNEPDCWWSGSQSFFSPFELAAMCSADYDGHLGKMGTTVGVKNADPNAKMVMPGIAKISLDYIKSMKAWADANRNGSFPADVINVHQYSTDAGGQYEEATSGISPEQDNLKGKMKKLTDYRDRYLPGKEVWLSEFGYDTDPNSIFKAPKIGTFSQEEVQGQWLIRSLLELAAAKVDRAVIYRLADDDGVPSSMKFATSGLTRYPSLSYEPKPSWYYVYTMKNVLKGMRFQKEELITNDVRVYSFKDATLEKGALAVWCPTSIQKKLDNFELFIGNQAKTATLVTLSDKNTEGVESPLKIVNGRVKINVSERPVFVVLDKVSESVLSTENKELANKITIYPTETDKDVFIEIESAINNDEIRFTLFDSRGIMKDKKVASGTISSQVTLNLGHLPAGVYLLNIESNGAVRTEKIIKY